MTRKECLDKAAECVLNDRQNNYGKPEDCFGMIARMWGAYLGVCISAHDVAAMMALLKIARFRHNPLHEDNAVDCAGYAACMVETATAWEREGEAKAEGCEDLVQDVAEECKDCSGFRNGPVPEECEGCMKTVESDAPQTREALYQHIMDVNPATYGHPRTPTGEELAEMAEEEDHA